MGVMSETCPLDSLIIKTIGAQLPDVQAIYRYGSAGSSYERQDSDVDIAILASHIVPFEKMMQLRDTLSHVTRRDIDIYELTEQQLRFTTSPVHYRIRTQLGP